MRFAGQSAEANRERRTDTDDVRSTIKPEWLSAYHDGEATPEERAQIESAEQSTADTQRLDEYGQLSSTLKQFHQSVPSPDLRDAVLEQISSNTGLQAAAPRPSSAATVSPVKSKPSSVRESWIPIVASLAGIAALVMIVVWPSMQSPGTGDSLAMNETSEPLLQESIAEADATIDSSLPMAAAGSAMSADVSPASAPMMVPAVESVAEMEANVELTLKELAKDQSSLEPGDILRYLDDNAEEITWVAVTVVDVNHAGDQMQVMLSKHGVELPTSADKVDHREASKTAAAQQGGDGEPIAILVESDWDQLEAVIDELSDQSFVDHVKVDAPQTADVPAEIQGMKSPERAGWPSR